MSKVKVTLTDAEGHRRHKVKVTRQGQRSQTWRCLRSLNASCLTFLTVLRLALTKCV